MILRVDDNVIMHLVHDDVVIRCLRAGASIENIISIFWALGSPDKIGPPYFLPWLYCRFWSPELLL